MQHLDSYLQQAADAAGYLASRGFEPVDVVVQCGSGLAELATGLLPRGRRINLDEIPHLPATTVTGHGKEAIYGQVADTNVLVLTGRIHLYEGHSPAVAGFPAAIAAACKAQVMICTNAAGALNPAMHRDSIVLHENYINFQCDNPLFGLEFPATVQRFVDPEPPYDPFYSQLLLRAMAATGATVHQGTYLAVRGPVFETQAELRMMQAWGADVVGMSTVPEVIVAHLCGLPVAGVSLVTNECFAGGGTIHAEVLDTSRRMAPLLAQGIRGLLENAS